MATFSVYVEGPLDPTQEAMHRLATAMSQRYGLPAAELVNRMSKGRFRVKANVDRATAETYAKDLKAIGARALIEETRPTGPVASLPASPTPPAGVGKQSGQFQSGLAAAFSQETPVASLGALENADQIALASLDGADATPATPGSFADPGLSASIGPPVPEVVAAIKPVRAQTSPPIDLFAPPDAQAANASVELAADEIEHRERRRSSTPIPVMSSSPPSTPVLKPRASSVASASQPAMTAVAIRRAEAPRWRFAAGVVIAIVLGFVPAHLVADMREKAVYAEIDRTVVAKQAQATTSDAYAALDAFRAEQADRKRSARTQIALIAFAIWAAAGAAVAYVWFARIPWHRRS